MNTRLLVVVMLMFTVCATEALARKWTDSTGKFSVEAELVDFKDGKVRLKKTNDKIITVALEKLCKADQAFVKKQASPELAHDDGRPAGKKSFPRGHAVAFDAPEGTWYLTSVRIHGARYGNPMPPKEDFHITLCDMKFKKIVDFPFPYKTFHHGPSKWVTLKTKPTKVPAKFVICAGFNAERTKGVYVSHDKSGKSLVGLPGSPAGYFTGGDWMIRARLDQVKSKDASKPGK